jgi:hypothetical protein
MDFTKYAVRGNKPDKGDEVLLGSKFDLLLLRRLCLRHLETYLPRSS